MKSHDTKAHDTLVLGAGLSGLCAAWHLHAAGQRVRVIESRARLGGRIASVPAAPVVAQRFDGHAHRLDLGPAWYWPDFNPRLKALITQLGLASFAQYSRGVGLFEARHGEIHRLPTGTPQPPESRRVVGGMASLIDALVARLSDTPIQLATRATRLDLTDDGVAVTVASVGGEHTLHAARVVSSLPPRLLAPLLDHEAGVAAATLAALRATPTWMAGQAKFVAAYPRAFWRDAGLNGDASSQRGPLAEIHDASDESGDTAALFGFVGAPPHIRRQLGETALREHALAQLARLFGPAAASPLDTWLHDWASDPMTATAADLAPVRNHPVAPDVALPEIWRDRLRLAGSEFASETAGYLEGAVEAAQAVVSEWG